MVSWRKDAEKLVKDSADQIEEATKQSVVAAVEDVLPKPVVPVSLVRKTPKVKPFPDFTSTLGCLVTPTVSGWHFRIGTEDSRGTTRYIDYGYNGRSYPRTRSTLPQWGKVEDTYEYSCSREYATKKARIFLQTYIDNYNRMQIEPFEVKLD